MLIYNTTFLVATPLVETWKQWAATELLVFMQADERMTDGQIARVLSHENENEGVSFSVQFKITDMQTLHAWHASNAANFQTLCNKRFGQQVIFFSTILEII